MILLANLLIALGTVLNGILWMMKLLIIGRVIISWVNADPYNGLVRFIHALTDPPIRLVRRYIPRTHIGPLDFAPFILLLLVLVLSAIAL
jgi:YggT family protein